MTNEGNETITRVFPIFAAAFAIIYIVVEQMNWPLFTYHARTVELAWLRDAAKAPNNPAMYWFGWLGTSALGAVVVSLAALPLTRGRVPPVWIGWAIPLVVIIVFMYLFRSFFIVR